MTPHYADDSVTLHLGRCEDVLPGLPPESVDAIVTDPPAAIAFMGREWDSNLGGRDRWVAWLAECMEKAARVLKPGGHLLVWSLPRTSGWTQWALEDAGLEVRDCIVHLFGSGFPKSLDVSKAIDKVGGVSPQVQGAVLRAARERAGLSRAEVAARVGCKEASVLNWEGGRARAAGRAVEYITPSPQYRDALADLLGYTADERRVTGASPDRRGDGSVIGLGHSGGLYASDAATEAAKDWEGWGTALKPGQEMWWLARKPLRGTVAANVLEYGTGALNVDGCKVGTTRDVPASLSTRPNDGRTYGKLNAGQPQDLDPDTGRWPPNIVFTHSAACDGQCAPDCPVAELDRQSGVLTSGGGDRGATSRYRLMAHYSDRERVTRYSRDADTGGASRFYPTFRYQAKAPTSERPRLDDGTAHETVKSLGLMRWLVRLITPPGGTVLDMFAGSGPTGEACIIEGFRCVLIEQNPKSAELIKARLSKPIQPAMFGLDEAS